jgi:threonine/homoserine/homoserine lactone efflux protein
MDPVPAAATGAMLGLAAGLSPGPLMTLVLAQSLRHGTRQGLLAAMAPLITDLPIILLTLLALNRLAESGRTVGAIGLAGSLFVLYLAYQTWRAAPPSEVDPQRPAGSLLKGVLVNALSPHPYLFWAVVGAPLVLQAAAAHPAAPWLFLGGFYGLLVGAKVVVALLAGRYRTRLNPLLHAWVMRLLALMLLAFALVLIRDALELLS